MTAPLTQTYTPITNTWIQLTHYFTYTSSLLIIELLVDMVIMIQHSTILYLLTS